MAGAILIALICYLLGSFPTGVIIGKLFKDGTDIRKEGSGNTGATNAFRVLGWQLGLIVGVIDIFKGFAAAYWITGISLFGSQMPPSVLFVVSTLSVVTGHIFPVFSGFRGGRGFGAAVGAVSSQVPLAAPFCLAVFLVTLGFTGYVSVCALAASVSLPLVYYIIHRLQGETPDGVILVFFIAIAVLTFYSVRKKLYLYMKGEAQVFEKAKIFRKRKEL